VHCTYAQHLAHQGKILNLVQGCEREVFNDPNVLYESRSHFTGQYGTMSNILTSCYFYLYFRLLGRGVKVNVKSDSITIFCLILQMNIYRMDRREIEYISRILGYFRQQGQGQALFDPDWWATLFRKISSSLERARSSQRFMDQELSESAKGAHLLGYISHALYEYGIDMEIYGPYEYRPEYVDMNGLRAENVIGRLTRMMQMFLTSG